MTRAAREAEPDSFDEDEQGDNVGGQNNNTIRSQQYARVRVTRYAGQLEDEGMGSAEDSAVQWLALEYIRLY